MRQKLGILTGIQVSYAVAGIAGHFSGVPDVVMFTACSILGFSQGWLISKIAKSHRAYRLSKVSLSTSVGLSPE